MIKILKNIVLPSVATSVFLFSAVPAFAWTGVSAVATISFSEGGNYYTAKGTGKSIASGTRTGDQRLINQTYFECNAYFVDGDIISDRKSPVTQSFTGPKEGDELYWYCDTLAEIATGSITEYTDNDSVERKHAAK